jgi:perosamine synthetase
MANLYLEGLKGHPWLDFMPKKTNYSENTYWVFPIILNSECPLSAKEMQTKLKSLGVETRRFFCPMSLQPVVSSGINTQENSYPISNLLWNRGIYLPSGLGITKNEIENVVSIFWKLKNDSI